MPLTIQWRRDKEARHSTIALIRIVAGQSFVVGIVSRSRLGLFTSHCNVFTNGVASGDAFQNSQFLAKAPRLLGLIKAP